MTGKTKDVKMHAINDCRSAAQYQTVAAFVLLAAAFVSLLLSLHRIREQPTKPRSPESFAFVGLLSVIGTAFWVASSYFNTSCFESVIVSI